MRNAVASLVALALALTTLITPSAKSASCCCAKLSAATCAIQKAKHAGCALSSTSCSMRSDRSDEHGNVANRQIEPSILERRVELPALEVAQVEFAALVTLPAGRNAPPEPPPPRT